MGIFFVVAWPLSKLLDCLLGQDHSTFFRRAELKVLVDLHGSTTGGVHGNKEHLTTDEVVIIKVPWNFNPLSHNLSLKDPEKEATENIVGKKENAFSLFPIFSTIPKRNSIFSSTGQRPASYCHGIVSILCSSVRLCVRACIRKLFLHKNSPQKY